ncbi:MAG: NUDIX pyrophosphatase [Ruminococcaceae bacterium]|nr:NUDIX pyrophosphatase [Oscillospiraceae bacterium]
MRVPFQILAIPYKYENGKLLYCVLHRSDCDQWQFIAGGGEDKETPEEAARREISEEGGIAADTVISLKSMCCVPAEIFPHRHLYGWPDEMYVVPEYAFGFACTGALVLSHEHTELVWLPYKEAREKLQWDSNKTALYELNCILSKQHDQ